MVYRDDDDDEFRDDEDDDFEMTSPQSNRSYGGSNGHRRQHSRSNNHRSSFDIEQTVVPELYSNRNTHSKWYYFLCTIIVGSFIVGTALAVHYFTSNETSSNSQQQPSGTGNNNNDEESSKSTVQEQIKDNVDKIQRWVDAKVTLNDGPNMYTVLSQIQHNAQSFTEGLTYYDGYLYESIGLEGQSAVLILNATDGTTIQSVQMDAKYFGEGLTYRQGQLIQLTYQAQTGFAYDVTDITKTPDTFHYTTTTNEGWGLTYDKIKDELIVSDGSDYIHFWDPTSMLQIRKIQVQRQLEKNSNNINELEFYRGRILANIWYEDTIIVINPDTGTVEKEYDFSQLWSQAERGQIGAGVLNGISISEDPDILYVTGKNWDRMFRVTLNYPKEGNDKGQDDEDASGYTTNNNDEKPNEDATAPPTSSPSISNGKGNIPTDNGEGDDINNNASDNDNSNTNSNNDVDQSDEATKWLAATVTLQNGPNMYEIVEQLTHSSSSFTEGLTYHDGILYESIGMKGQSAVVAMNATDMTVTQQVTMSSAYFGEGLTYRDGYLIQLTWKTSTGFIYNASNFDEEPTTFQFTTTRNEGWGLTYDPINDEFIVSDGSKYLHFWDTTTMLQKRTVEVIRQDNKETKKINELEYYRGRVLANIWYEDTIIVIDPETGIVDKEYDFSELWPESERRTVGADVLNGISVSEDPDILYITGKYWDRMFRIRLKY